MLPEPTYDLSRAAELLERLLTDAALRAEFRADPAAVCTAFGVPDLAERLAAEGNAFQTLELRESKSSLAGVLMAAAAEGIGAFELISHFRDSGALAPDAAVAVDRALTRMAGMPAVTPEQAEAARLGASAPASHSPDHAASGAGPDWARAPSVSDQDAPAANGEPQRAGAAADLDPDDDPPPTACPLCEVKNPDKLPDYTPCEQCGAPAPVGTYVCAVCDSGGAFKAPEPAAGSFGRAASLVGSDGVRAGMAATPGAGPSVAPVDPSSMSNTNEGGKLHGSEFNMRDAEGAPGPNGRIHAGYDLFGDANAPIRAPEGGVVVEVRPSRGTSGQVFGGTVKVQSPDGRVWVFRHVTPGSVKEGETVAAGAEIAKVSPWNDGPEHTHIEIWKTYSGGYNAANMEDPFPILKQLYSGQGAASAPAAAPAVVPAAVPGAIPSAAAPVASVPVAAPAAPAPPTPAALVQGGRVMMPDALRAEFAAGRLDPRVSALVSGFASQYQIGISTVFDDGAGVRVIISSVNGQPVGPGNIAARDLAQSLAGLPAGRPTDVVTPWAIGSQGFRNDPSLIDRIELGFAGTVPPGTPVPPIVPVPVAPSPAVVVPAAAAPPPGVGYPPPPPGYGYPPVPPPGYGYPPPPPGVAYPPAPPPGTAYPPPAPGYGYPPVPPPGTPVPVPPVPPTPVPPAVVPPAAVPPAAATPVPPPVTPAPAAPAPVPAAPVPPVAATPPVAPAPPAVPAPVPAAPVPPVAATPPVAPAPPAVPAPAAAPAGSAPAGASAPETSYGRQSGVFQVAKDQPASAAEAPATPAPVAAAPPPAVAPAAAPVAPPVDPSAAPPATEPTAPSGTPATPTPEQAIPPPDTAPAAPPSDAASELPDPTDAYPGDSAPKEEVARWMARQAEKAGLPPELPVMAALVESGLRNLNYGDADSVGFFQMRVSIWDQGEYAGYQKSAELQLKWFLDQAGDLKEKRLADGLSGFGKDPNAFGTWIADVERPAAQYRGRYQLRLDEARKLIYG